ncbi:hypothetical protein PIB30_058969 [Stylosanthes scabra]|uniref:Uncharacterized protein n=1 Tax=Stylosanthes scabra TaxID=79078 RepID=A0ABU6SL30_9FABA|nr:hypothetical protein [Stylosanthes scabra]
MAGCSLIKNSDTLPWLMYNLQQTERIRKKVRLESDGSIIQLDIATAQGRSEGRAVLLRRVGFTTTVCTLLGRASIRSSTPRPPALPQPQVLSYFSHGLLFDHLSPNHFNNLYQFLHMYKGYSSLLSSTVTDINTTVTKLMALGAELDGPIKYEIHGKVATMWCLDGHMLGLYMPI